MTISIVIPCFNEEESVPIFFKEVEKIALQIHEDIEYIFVDDGSKDGTLSVLKELSGVCDRVNYVSFSRNFGKEAALYAGLKQAKGEYVAVMDADLQDPPELLVQMKSILDEDEDIDCVGSYRVNRKGEPFIRSIFAKLFYHIINKISQLNIVDGARDFRLMRRQMVESILELSEYNRFSKGIFAWVGFKTKYLEYTNIERVAGSTSWSFWSLFKYSLEGIINFSDAPLNISFFVGGFVCLVSFILMFLIVVRTLIMGNPTSGWTSIVTILLFLGGLQLLSIGIVGKYIGKIFLETKKRPIYLIKERNNKSI
ncbi:glycosyltransferase family 2 protein [Streptococcus sp. V869]